MSPTARPITAPTKTSKGVCPRSSRSRASCTPRMWKRSSTRRLSTSAWRPAARRRPAAAPPPPEPPRAPPAARSRLRACRSSSPAPQADRPARAFRSSRGGGHSTEDAVHKPAGLVARKGLRQLDRFVDGCLGGHLAFDGDLVDGDPQDDAVHLRHLV